MVAYDHIENNFKGRASIDIYYQAWLAKKPKAVVVLVHGIGEHSSRYMNIIESQKSSTISFYSMDLRGHGKSGGKRGHVTSFIDYVYDLKLLINKVKENNPELPIYLVGHSLGGLIATRFSLTYQEDISGLILLSPAFRSMKALKGIKKFFVALMLKISPSFLFKNNLSPEDLTHDKAIVKEYISDELVHNKISASWIKQYFVNGEYCLERASEIKSPLLVLHGKNDKIVDISGAEQFVEKVNSKDKTIQIFDELYHELMNEKKNDRIKVLSTINKWIAENISGKTEKPVNKSDNKPTKKKVTKKAAKKVAKKVTKKSVKKVAKKVAKKSVKKSAKKVAKKSVKKSAKKVAKKSVKKSAKKVTKKANKKK